MSNLSGVEDCLADAVGGGQKARLFLLSWHGSKKTKCVLVLAHRLSFIHPGRGMPTHSGPLFRVSGGEITEMAKVKKSKNLGRLDWRHGRILTGKCGMVLKS